MHKDNEIIYDLLKTDRKERSEFQKEVRETSKEIVERLSKIEALDEIQNEQLEYHIRRTNMLEDLHRQNEERIINLEQPHKTLKTIVKWSSGAGAIVGLIYTVIRLLDII